MTIVYDFCNVLQHLKKVITVFALIILLNNNDQYIRVRQARL